MHTQRISKRQALLGVLLTIIGAVLQPLFRALVLWGGNGAWLAIVLTTVAAMLVFTLVIRLATRFPQESAANYLPRIWGKLIGYPLVILLLSCFLAKAAFILRHVSEFFVSAVLPETPISAVMIVLVTMVLAGVLAELEGIARFSELVIPVIGASLLLVFLGSLRQFSGWRLLPLFDQGLSGFLETCALPASFMANLALILFIYPLLVDPAGITINAAKTLAIAGGVFLLIYLNIILVFGSAFAQSFTWPYLAVVENISIGVDRSEALFMISWLLAAFASASLFIYIFSLGICQLFPRMRLRLVGSLGVLIAAYIALQSDNQPSAIISHQLVNRYSAYLFVGVPLLSLALAAVRGKVGEEDHG